MISAHSPSPGLLRLAGVLTHRMAALAGGSLRHHAFMWTDPGAPPGHAGQDGQVRAQNLDRGAGEPENQCGVSTVPLRGHQARPRASPDGAPSGPARGLVALMGAVL